MFKLSANLTKVGDIGNFAFDIRVYAREEDYVARCRFREGEGVREIAHKRPDYKPGRKYRLADITTVLTSDDIFHSMLDLRSENDRKYQKSRALMDKYTSFRGTVELPRHLNFETGYNVEEYRRGVELLKAKHSSRYGGRTFNKLLLDRVGKMERGFSNGETALMRLSELLDQPGLYLLDEPENSMSCEFQQKLVDIITYLSRYGECQFLISTHSPFLLAMDSAKIYNLDDRPVGVRKWWELDNMRRYFELFDSARDRFLGK